MSYRWATAGYCYKCCLYLYTRGGDSETWDYCETKCSHFCTFSNLPLPFYRSTQHLLVSSLSLTITGSFHTTGFWVISNMFDMALMDIKHVWYLRFEIGEALIKSVALQVISVNPSLYQIVGVDNWFEAALTQEGLCSYRKERIELDPKSAQLSSSLGPTLAACDNGQRYRCPFLLCLG